MNKGKTGIILGILSLVPVIVCIITFFILRGPDFNPYVGIPIGVISSIVGMILAGVSSWKSKRNIGNLAIGIVGLIANLVILVCTLLLLFAFGMGEA